MATLDGRDKWNAMRTKGIQCGQRDTMQTKGIRCRQREYNTYKGNTTQTKITMQTNEIQCRQGVAMRINGLRCRQSGEEEERAEYLRLLRPALPAYCYHHQLEDSTDKLVRLPPASQTSMVCPQATAVTQQHQHYFCPW